MFNTDKDYFNSIKHAQVHNSIKKESSNKLLVFNLLLLSVIGYMTYSSFVGTQSQFSLSSLKQGVLGVSETVDDSEINQEKLMKILKDSESTTIPNSMKVLTSKTSIQSKSAYTEDLATVLDDNDRSGFKGRIAVVKHSDN